MSPILQEIDHYDFSTSLLSRWRQKKTRRVSDFSQMTLDWNIPSQALPFPVDEVEQERHGALQECKTLMLIEEHVLSIGLSIDGADIICNQARSLPRLNPKPAPQQRLPSKACVVTLALSELTSIDHLKQLSRSTPKKSAKSASRLPFIVRRPSNFRAHPNTHANQSLTNLVLITTKS